MVAVAHIRGEVEYRPDGWHRVLTGPPADRIFVNGRWQIVSHSAVPQELSRRSAPRVYVSDAGDYRSFSSWDELVEVHPR